MSGMNNLSRSFNPGLNTVATQPGEGGLHQKLFQLIVREITQGAMAIRTRDLLGGLLDLAAIEQFIGRKERCNVKAMVERSFERNHAAAAKKQIVFLAGIPEGISVQADRRALQQVFDRLIAGAIRNSPANGTVQVHALPQKDGVVINVRDQGTGINESGRQKLFQKFSRLMAFPDDGDTSSGIALAIVKRLAEGLSGSIRWRGDSESGSTVTLRLPAATDSGASAEFSDIQMLARRIIEFQARN